jgi:hypothetical protein
MRFRAAPDGAAPAGDDSEGMKENLAARIVWRRQGVRHHYVGTLSAGEEGIRLTGRDPKVRVEVAFSIPLGEIDNIRVGGNGDELLAGERCVVLELAGSEAIFLREVGAGPLQVQVLARNLGALIRAPQLLAQGG